MNSQELEAYGELAQAITRHVYDDAKISREKERPEFREIEGPIYYHWHMSPFESAAYNLLRLGILNDAGAPHGRPFVNFSFNCSVGDAGKIAKQNWISGPTFLELLSAFIGLYGYYDRDTGFSIDRNEPFNVDNRIAPALDAIALLGYVTKAEKGYVWTELAAPAMYENYLWPNYSDGMEP